MKRVIVLIISILSTISLIAQDQTIKKLQAEAGKAVVKPEDDTLKRTWKKGGIYTLSIGQGSLSNWAAGGDNFSFTGTTILNLFAFYQEDRHSWDNTFDISLGYVNTTSTGGRKNDDRLDYLSKYGFH